MWLSCWRNMRNRTEVGQGTVSLGGLLKTGGSPPSVGGAARAQI